MGDFSENNVVLVVDDDEMNLQVAKMILEKKLPCTVITARSGEKCIEILKSQYVRLVLLDILMPEMDGIETLEKIRSDDKIKNTQIVMLTASLDKDNIKKASALGVRDYVKKPFMPNELIERVSKKLITETSNKVLAVVDENNIEAWKIILEDNFKHEFVMKTTGLGGVEFLRKAEVSLVIISADLKFIEGYKVLNFLASEEKFENTPLAVTSPNKLFESVKKLKMAEAEDENYHANKKKVAHVVTNLIGYSLDSHI